MTKSTCEFQTDLLTANARLINMISTGHGLSTMLSFSVCHQQLVIGKTTLADTKVEIRQLLDKCKDQEGERDLAFCLNQ
jgi:hypothetical protein